MYFVIVGVCAPVWEEAIFRGFLLPSLGRWMPVPGAIAASAFIFALAHLQGACGQVKCWLTCHCGPTNEGHLYQATVELFTWPASRGSSC